MAVKLRPVVWRRLAMALLVAVPAPARADVVPPPPDECPPASDLELWCGLAFCRAYVCETEADCKGGDCEPVEGCFGSVDWFRPPRTEHGGPCLRDHTCSDEDKTCQTLKLCLSFGDGTTGEGTTSGTSSTTNPDATSSGSTAPTSGEPSTSTGASSGTGVSTSATTGPSSGSASGTSSGSEGGGCTCSLADGGLGWLALFGLAARRRRRRSSSR